MRKGCKKKPKCFGEAPSPIQWKRSLKNTKQRIIKEREARRKAGGGGIPKKGEKTPKKTTAQAI